MPLKKKIRAKNYVYIYNKKKMLWCVWELWCERELLEWERKTKYQFIYSCV